MKLLADSVPDGANAGMGDGMDMDVGVQPPIAPMGPMDLGRILSGAFRLFRTTPAVTVGFPNVATLVEFGVLVAGGLALGLDRPQHWLPVVVFLAIVGLLGVALAFICVAATFVVLDHAVRGPRIGSAAALALGLRRAPGLAGVFLMDLGICSLIIMVGVVPFALLPIIGPTDGASGVLFVILLAVVALATFGFSIHFQVALVTAGPAHVVEGVGVLAALAVARELTRGNWWRTAGILFVFNLLVNVATNVAIIPMAVSVLFTARASMSAGYGLAGSGRRC